VAGQSLERREVLRLLSFASAAAGFPGFRRWIFACDHACPGGRDPSSFSGPYTPLFFSPDEYAALELLADLIIPGDTTPGAREAGVSEFIDFMVASDPEIQTSFRYGIGWIDAHARFLYAKGFRDLSPDQQNDMLKHLAYRDGYRPGEEDGRAFVELMREWTVKGFYTSRIGLEHLGYPGLRTVWEMYDPCPHKDDPEHQHLPPPQI